MPLRLDIKRKLTVRSDRVKCVDQHNSEHWLLCSLYNGEVSIWDHETQTQIKKFEVCNLPVRAARFVPRKNWVLTASDDMQVRVFNYNTLERIHSFEAHSDYIRDIAVHPSQPFILTSSDDMMIKLWNWDRNWICEQVYEGHVHYVMQVVFNPKDNNTFASASLDRTIKVWQLGSSTANFTLEGHEKGVNCVDYYHSWDKPYLISGADDRLIKIWDYQNKSCVQTLEGHSDNVSVVKFHPELPIVLTGSEDGTVRIWHSGTYRLESTLNYGFERIWNISCIHGANDVAIGYDEGTIMIKVGRDEPAVSMDVNGGKIVWARHNEMQQANLKAMPEGIDRKDGQRLPLAVKDMGSCEIFPQMIAHNPNGRFVVVCGDGEYIIYTSMALRNKAYGSAQEFVWATDSSDYATLENATTVKVFRNFKERKSFKPEYGADGIFGGAMLGVRSVSGMAFSFFDWETLELVRRIEIQPRSVYWSENGHLVCLASADSYHILRCNVNSNSGSVGQKNITDDGIENAFEALGEINEVVKTGLWVGDCFIYTNSVNRINYYVGGENVTLSHLDQPMYLLGYVPKQNSLYLCDKDLNVVSYTVLLSVLEYQTAFLRKDFDGADAILPTVPKEHRTRLAHFLEKHGFRPQALAISTDPEHKFDLALSLGDLNLAMQLAEEADLLEADIAGGTTPSRSRWCRLGNAACARANTDIMEVAYRNGKEYGSLIALASSTNNKELIEEVAKSSLTEQQNNVAFMSFFMLGYLDECLDLLIQVGNLPEAAFFARSYLPSRVNEVVLLWKFDLLERNIKSGTSLAIPQSYMNLFPEYQDSLELELNREKLKPSKPIVKSCIPNGSSSHVYDDYSDSSLALQATPEVASNHCEIPLRNSKIPSTGVLEPTKCELPPVQFLQEEAQRKTTEHLRVKHVQNEAVEQLPQLKNVSTECLLPNETPIQAKKRLSHIEAEIETTEQSPADVHNEGIEQLPQRKVDLEVTVQNLPIEIRNDAINKLSHIKAEIETTEQLPVKKLQIESVEQLEIQNEKFDKLQWINIDCDAPSKNSYLGRQMNTVNTPENLEKNSKALPNVSLIELSEESIEKLTASSASQLLLPAQTSEDDSELEDFGLSHISLEEAEDDALENIPDEEFLAMMAELSSKMDKQ